MTEQRPVYRCVGMLLASNGFAVQGVGAHAGQHGADAFAQDSVVFSMQEVAQHPDFRQWRSQMPLVDPVHEPQIR